MFFKCQLWKSLQGSTKSNYLSVLQKIETLEKQSGKKIETAPHSLIFLSVR
jgi:hypothetical protein